MMAMTVSRVALNTIFVGDLIEIRKPGHCRPYIPSGRFRRLMEKLHVAEKRQMWGVAMSPGKKGDIITVKIMGQI